MRGQYARALKVSTPEGKRIYAKIFRSKDDIQIEINYLEVVKKDDPPFSHNGVIRMHTTIEKYKDTIKLLTKYLEDLFLKGMADEDTYRGLGAKPKSRRTKKINLGREVKSFKGERDSSSLHAGSRREKPTEGSGQGKTDSEMAESSNSENSGKDWKWN